MIQNAQEFISLISTLNTLKAYQLIGKKPQVVAALFQNAEEFIQLANTGYEYRPGFFIYKSIGAEIAYQIISKESDKIASLFTDPAQFIKLAQTDTSPALALVNLQANKIYNLFGSVPQFLNLVEKVNLNIVCALTLKNSDSISALFIRNEDLKKLNQVNKLMAANITLLQKNYFKKKQMESYTKGGLIGMFKDRLPKDVSGYIASFINDDKTAGRIARIRKDAYSQAKMKEEEFKNELVMKIK